MFRKVVTGTFEKGKTDFRLRGHEVLRIEAFSDAVFAFAVTLLIVSLEVPGNFHELLTIMRGFLAFGISFSLLMMIWYEQNIFFRRYGLSDLKTVVLNCTLIFLVLFYVYPLKFLFTMLLSADSTGAAPDSLISTADLPKLMLIYGAGFMSIYMLFALMFAHALKKAPELELTASEIFDTKTKLYKNMVMVSIGLLSVIISFLLSADKAGISGMAYILIGPALSIFFTYRKKQKLKLYGMG